MRSGNRKSAAAGALLLLCACGNLSNQDVAFLEAVPQKGALKLSVPRGDTAQPACALGPADVWTSTKTTSDGINAGLDGILSLVDAIRGFPPSTRSQDARTWGPWPDDKHPGVQFRVQISRELDANGIPWRWIYVFEARRSPGAFLPILEGEFFGAQARNGVGRLVIHFENSIALGINNPKDPTLPARFYYDLSGDPRTISLDTTDNPVGFGLVGFDYFYAGYLDGHGRFDYALPPDTNGCRSEITTWFTAAGAGKATLHVHCGPFTLGDVIQCWDQVACLSYVDDPFAFTPSCLGAKPCKLGNIASCPF
jgi:hypothetical protein